MAWQGIPFKFSGLGAETDIFNLAVSKLPDLVLKTDPNYTNLIITAAVSLAAGIIPAGIAFLTFRQNTKLIRNERVNQQEFLKSEREEQQRFLESERAQQIASMEADRMTQKEIAERNFNMEVLSSNRQEWINKIRDLMSDYIINTPSLFIARMNCMVYREAAEKSIQDSGGIINESNKKKLDDARVRLDNLIFDNKKIAAHMKLMLNPSESFYKEIVGIFSKVDSLCYLMKVYDESVYEKTSREILIVMDHFTEVSQSLLKYEWERVKKGV